MSGGGVPPKLDFTASAVPVALNVATRPGRRRVSLAESSAPNWGVFSLPPKPASSCVQPATSLAASGAPLRLTEIQGAAEGKDLRAELYVPLWEFIHTKKFPEAYVIMPPSEAAVEKAPDCEKMTRNMVNSYRRAKIAEIKGAAPSVSEELPVTTELTQVSTGKTLSFNNFVEVLLISLCPKAQFKIRSEIFLKPDTSAVSLEEPDMTGHAYSVKNSFVIRCDSVLLEQKIKEHVVWKTGLLSSELFPTYLPDKSPYRH